MSFDWTHKAFATFLSKKLCLDDKIAVALAHGILKKWTSKQERESNTRIFMSNLKKNQYLMKKLKSTELSVDSLLCMTTDDLQTDINKLNKKKHMQVALTCAIITNEMDAIVTEYETGQQAWRGQHKQKNNYAKTENIVT
jgi:CRISPR/Cas system-associated protein endoribonuclease Cas2